MPKRRRAPAEEALARVVLGGHLGVRRGEPVTVESWSHALPWARAMVVEARRRGARPTLLVEDESAFFRSLEALGSSAVARLRPPDAGPGGAWVYLDGPEEFPRLLGLPAKDLERILARHDRAWWSRARRGRVRGLRVAVGDATAPAAARFGVDREAWESELLRASLVGPEELELRAQPVLRRLAHSRRLRVRHPNGTDLRLELAPRPPTVDIGRPDPPHGVVWARVPAGLVIAPLRPRATDGTWETNRPAYDRYAQPSVALGGRFVFRRGRLTEFAFDRGGGPFASAQLRAGPGAVRAVALTIGLNPAIDFAPEFQELGAGTLGLWLGEATYRPDLGRPRIAFLAALTEASVEADDRPRTPARPAPRR